MRERAVSVSVISVALALFLAGTGWGAPLQKKSLSLEDARKAGAAAAAEAKKNQWNMAIAVVDDGGHLLYFERIDETQIGSIDIAIGKARTAACLQTADKSPRGRPQRRSARHPDVPEHPPAGGRSADLCGREGRRRHRRERGQVVGGRPGGKSRGGRLDLEIASVPHR